MPTALYHWSDAEPEIFNTKNAIFETQTQGRVYCVENPRDRKATTKSKQARSLIIFTEESTSLFEKHPAFTLLGFKRLYGQYRSTKFGDIEWGSKDCFRHGRLIIVKKAQIVPICDNRRRRWQIFKYAAVKVSDFLMTLLILCAAWAFLDAHSLVRNLLNWTAGLLSQTAWLIIILASALSLVFVPRFVRVKVAESIPEGWDVWAELECAGFRADGSIKD